jgi:hypothetical protein
MRVQTHALIPWLTFTAVRAAPSELVDWGREESDCLPYTRRTLRFVVAWGCRVMHNHHPSCAESCERSLYLTISSSTDFPHTLQLSFRDPFD